jgi:outer membrane protein assembly factor BamB
VSSGEGAVVVDHALMRVVLCTWALVACSAGIAAGSAAADDWPRFGGDPQVTNDVSSVVAPDFRASAASRLQVRWTSKLDGPVIASPLYAGGVTVGQQVLDVVYAATQAGSVYALDARDGTVLWQRPLGTAVSTCDEAQAGTTASYGIASTGVVDRARGVLYVIGATGLLYALDLGTGETETGWPLQVIKDPTGEFVWGGLTLAGGRLYVPVASYCDEPGADGSYADGRLDAVDVDSVSVVRSFDVIPGVDDLGSIWGWGGASVDPGTGDLWVATGNSWVSDNSCGCIVQDAGYAEAVVQLDPDLNVVAFSRPSDLPGEVEDADFGSTPLLFQPSGCPPYAAAYAKNGELYVWRRDALADGPVWSFHAGPSDITNAFVGEPSYSPELNMLIVADARTYDEEGSIVDFDAVTGFKIGPGCSLPEAPTWVAPGVGRGPKAPALVVGNLAFVVGGLVPGVFVLDATTGALDWSQELGGPVLAPPAFGGDQVYVGDTSGGLSAIGVGPTPPPLPPPPPPPPPPARLVAGTVVHTPADAGKPFRASMPVRSGGRRVVGAVRCSAKIGGRSLPHERATAAGDGSARCTWRLPSAAGGLLLVGSITESYGGSRVRRGFFVRVRAAR